MSERERGKTSQKGMIIYLADELIILEPSYLIDFYNESGIRSRLRSKIILKFDINSFIYLQLITQINS